MTSGLTPPGASARRAALLEELVVALTTAGGDALPIRTRAPDDPTIALLDAWATVGDVIGFYLDRIADEGYLATAVESGSILAMANLVGYQPLPGLAAQVYVAYLMGPDPTDTAVQFDAGLLFQSVPGAGQQAQTFESAQGVLARPSWGLLTPKTSQPVSADTSELVIAGTATGLAPNSVVVLDLAESGSTAGQPALVSVQSATIDYTNGVTNVSLQSPAVTPPPTAASAPAAPAPTDTTMAIDNLLDLGDLTRAAPALPGSVNDLSQSPKAAFAAGSDVVPRMLSALQPAVAGSLYAALGTTTIGTAAVTGASAMQVSAAPFGATAPPKTVFGPSGQPAGTEPWPIADTFGLTLSLTEDDLYALVWQTFHDAISDAPRHGFGVPRHAPDPRVVQVTCTDGTRSSDATIEIPHLGDWTATPSGFGQTGLATSKDRLVLSYAGTTDPFTPALRVDVTLDPKQGGLSLEFVDPSTGTSLGSEVWDPNVRTPFSASIGDTQLAITWAAPPAGAATVTIAIQTPLPLADRKVLPLDALYGGIVPETLVAIASPGLSTAITTTVTAVDTVAISAYGMTGKVTSLTLADDWIGADALLQTALQSITVYAQPASLPLNPAPVTDDVSGQSIELDALVAGMAPGRLIAVTGTRTDLAGGATVPSGEIAMIATVSDGAQDGDTTYSTLNLAAPLAYSYARGSVKLYGNVVAAHQGATITQVLGSGQPAQAPQSFTLTSGPLLADPAAADAGGQSSLTVTVDGVGYARVARVDASTPPRSYVEGISSSGNATITFPAPLPAGTGNIVATYRSGDGSQGNVAAGQISQLLTRPTGLSSVINPLPAAGGSAGDDQESVRSSIPLGLSSLGRVVTVSDYGALAEGFSGVASASATGGPGGVVVTIAGTDPVPAGDDLCTAVAAALSAVADPAIPVTVVAADLYVIALTANVVSDPLVGWDATVAAVRAALVTRCGYGARGLGQDVAVSDLAAAAHTAPGVLSFTVTGLALIPVTATAGQLTATLPNLLAAPVAPVATLAAAAAEWGIVPAAGAPAPAAIAFVSAAAPDTLILTEQPS